jgi:glutathione synthase/RimK-type ligase-like ATP-grasp enzyme
MIAIHHRKKGFSEKWIEYCEKNDVQYKIVNCFDSDIVEKIKDCDGLMWHWPHTDLKAQLFARQMTYSIEKMGIKVFPDSKTCWHYDDKVGQKYLLESIEAPLVPSYVFYDKKEAFKWAKSVEYPKVFKTRNGAGAQNVRLIHSKRDACKIINKAFGKGIPAYDKKVVFKDSLWKLKRDKSIKAIGRVLKYFGLLTVPSSFHKDFTVEKNYVYFQDFIPDCDFDYRMKVIGDRCWGLKRYVRKGDFRASGSGLMDFEPGNIPSDLVLLSFKIANKLKLQSVAFDFVENNNQYFLIEISYASSMAKGQAEYGFWDSGLNWHEGKFTPEYFMVEDMLQDIS